MNHLSSISFTSMALHDLIIRLPLVMWVVQITISRPIMMGMLYSISWIGTLNKLFLHTSLHRHSIPLCSHWIAVRVAEMHHLGVNSIKWWFLLGSPSRLVAHYANYYSLTLPAPIALCQPILHKTCLRYGCIRQVHVREIIRIIMIYRLVDDSQLLYCV